MIDKDSISLLRSRRTKSLSIILMDVSYPLDEKIQEGFDKITRKRYMLFSKSRFLYGFNAYVRLTRVYIFKLLGKDAYKSGHGI